MGLKFLLLIFFLVKIHVTNMFEMRNVLVEKEYIDIYGKT